MNKRILAVDDDPGIVKVLTARLEANQYEVIPAYDGEEGLELVKTEKPDLILLDILMPKMDGYTFIRKLRECETDAPIPVIVLTGKEKMEELFTMEGVQDYITKPFDHEELISKIRNCFNK